MDCFSRFAVAVPIPNKDAHTVAKAIVENVFLRFGLCSEILSDRGREFDNAISSELCRILGIRKLRTTAYSPATNGICEVWHKV